MENKKVTAMQKTLRQFEQAYRDREQNPKAYAELLDNLGAIIAASVVKRCADPQGKKGGNENGSGCNPRLIQLRKDIQKDKRALVNLIEAESKAWATRYNEDGDAERYIADKNAKYAADLLARERLGDGIDLAHDAITGEAYDGDISFLATLRALVYPRIKGDETIRLRFRSTSYSADTVNNHTSEAVISAVYNPRNVDDGMITVNSFSGSSSDIQANFKVFEYHFTKVYNGWERIEKITDFFRKSFYSLCYIHPENRKVLILVESLSLKEMHYLQCAILAFLPWYFNPEDGVEEDEMNLINSLREKTAGAYEACIAKIAEKYNFRETYIRESLKGIEAKIGREECKNIERAIRGIESDIKSYSDSISTLLVRKMEQDTKLLGLKMKIEESEDNSEIMDYFLCNKRLFLTNVEDNGTIEFFVKDYVTYFDEDMVKQVLGNKRSYIYSRSSNYDKSDVEKLMRAIFIDQTLKLKFCAAYMLDIRNQRVRALSGYDFGSDIVGAIPNYHIQEYSCLGNYERIINESMRKNDYIGVLEQCVASCKSLNFSDSTVMETFMIRFASNRNKCIELPNGDAVTFSDAIKFLKDLEKPDEEDDKQENAEGETETEQETAEEYDY